MGNFLRKTEKLNGKLKYLLNVPQMPPPISQQILSAEEQAKFQQILSPQQKAKIISDLSRYANK